MQATPAEINLCFELLGSAGHPRVKFFDSAGVRHKLSAAEVRTKLSAKGKYKICGTAYKINRIFELEPLDAAVPVRVTVAKWMYNRVKQGRACVLPSIEWVRAVNGEARTWGVVS